MRYYEETYGDDIDGNRGVKQLVGVVEQSDLEDVVEQSDLEDVVEALYEGFLEDNTTGTQTIMLYCARAEEEIEVKVEIDDYIENLIEKAEADEDVKGSREMQEWLKELKNTLAVESILRKAKKGVKFVYLDSNTRCAVEILPKDEQIKGDEGKGYIAIDKKGFYRVPANKIKEV